MREQHGQGVRRRGSAALAGVVSAGDEPVHRAGRAGLGTGRPGLAGTAGTGGPVLPSQPWPGWDGPELPDEWLAPASAAAPGAGPDGRLAFIDDRDGAPALWLLEPAAAEPGGRAPGLGTQRRVDTGPGYVRAVSWSPDGAWLAVAVAEGGGELAQVRVLRPDQPGWRAVAGGPADQAGAAARAGAATGRAPAADVAAVLTAVPRQPAPRRPGTAARLGPWTPDGSRLVVCESDASGQTSALLVDPATGAREALARRGGLEVTDIRPAPAGGWLLVAADGARGRRRQLLIDTASGAVTPLVAGLATVTFGRFGADGTSVLVVSNAGRERAALLMVGVPAGPPRAAVPAQPGPVDEPGSARRRAGAAAGERWPAVGAVRLLAGRADADLEHLALMPGGSSAVLGWNVAGRTELAVLDLGSGRSRWLPPPPGGGVVTALAATSAGGLLLALVGPASPGELWETDDAAHGAYWPLVSHVPVVPARRAGSAPAVKAPSARAGAAAAPAAVARAGVLPVRSPLARPTEVVFRGAGDLPLTGWLYQPPRLRGPVRPGAGHPPGPAFLWLHGGPECQERPVFSPLLQALAARGITVLAPNVRGSAGYGRAFERSDDLAGRFGAIADVAACWEYLVGSGLADPARVGIGGRSYGGYLTLAALVTYPRLFRAGVDVCGMSDLETFYADTEPWIAAAAVTKYGDPVADQDLLRALSPVHRLATDLAAPLLVVHGANDTNVGVREAAQAVAAVADGGGTCQQLYFLDEGHDIARRANRLRFVREVTRWLADHLLDGTPATPPAQRHGRQPATDR